MTTNENIEDDVTIDEMVDAIDSDKELAFDEPSEDINFENNELNDYETLLEEFDEENNVFD